MGLETIVLKAGDTQSIKNVQVAGRYLTVVEADAAIEINANGRVGENDAADRIKFGEDYEDGGVIKIRNTSELENRIVLNSAGYESVSQKVANVNADLSNINIAGGTVGIDNTDNGVRVLNEVTLAGLAAGVKLAVSADPVEVNNFPSGFAINNQPTVNVGNWSAKPKYTVAHETHTLTAADVAAGGWTFNNGTAERLIIKASRDVNLGGMDFAEGEQIKLNDLAPNQDFVFSGLEGQEIDIIKMTVA